MRCITFPPPCLAALFLVAWTAAPLAAQEAFFDEGNRRYQEGNYAGAVELYQRILESGVESGELHYNLGNAWFRLGELGPAILHYERGPADHAARRRPGSEPGAGALADRGPGGAAAGLLALSGCPLVGRSAAPSSPAHRRDPGPWLAGMTALVVLVTGRGDFLLAWSRRAAAAAGVVTLVFGLSLVARELDVGRPDEAVIMAEEAPVHSAPSDDDELLIFTVHEGARVRVERRSDAWVEIVLEDGRVGWVRSGQLTLI